MNSVSLVIVIVGICVSSAAKCGMTDFLEQLIQSVNAIQRNGQSCGSTSEARVGKAGPQGLPGPRGPPGFVNMSAIEQRIQQMIDENRQYLLRNGQIVPVCYLGMKSRLIPDSAVSASSYWSAAYLPYQGRLDNSIQLNHRGCWASRENAIGHWLQIDMGIAREIAGIVTQGRPSNPVHIQWVTSYKVHCGVDSSHLTVVSEDGKDKIFVGNSDMDTKVYNRFPEVLSCRYVRIYPQAWHIHMSMRVELVSGACFNHTVPWY